MTDPALPPETGRSGMFSNGSPVELVLMGSVFLPAEALQPFADALAARGHVVAVVAPTDTRSADAVLEACAEVARRHPGCALIAHSNAGNVVPGVIARASVGAAVFMDAVLPPFDGGTWPVVPAGAAATLKDRVEAGLLPPWTRWFPSDDVEPLFPSSASFGAVDAVAPRVRFSYLGETLSAASGWSDAVPCGYLMLSEAYGSERQRAGAAGWPTRDLRLGHLGMLRDPEAVAEATDDLLSELARPDSDRAGHDTPRHDAPNPD
ncbi:hypothetical protein ACX9R5_09010 [Rathayibacter sp. CAU 1779]